MTCFASTRNCDTSFAKTYFLFACEDVKQPRDISAIEAKLQKGIYPHPLDFREDFAHLWNNAIHWNAEDSDISIIAKSLKTQFEILYQQCQFTREYEVRLIQ